MNADQKLAVYLQDHLAGSEAGLRRFEHTRKSNPEGELGLFLSRCVEELREDREQLRRVILALGAQPTVFKQAAAFVGERMARLKSYAHGLAHSPLARLEDLEALYLGVAGKWSMWRLLRELSQKDARLRLVDYERLIARAEKQLESIDRFRRAAGRELFIEGRIATHATVPA